MTGTNYPAITPKDLEQFEVALPSDDHIQSVHAKKLDALDFSIEKVKSKIEGSKNLQKSLINQIF